MADSPLTTTQNAKWIPTVVANESLGLLSSYLQIGKTVSKDVEMNPVRLGQILSIPRRGVITATQKTQGSNSTKQNPTADDVQITVDQHWYVKIAEEDFTRSLQTESALPGYAEDAVIVLAEKIESVLLSKITSFANIDAASGAGNAYAGVVDVRTAMNNLKVPILARRYGYISPRFAGRLLKETAISDPKMQPNDSQRVEGSIGRTAGFDLFEGQLTPTAGSPAWDQNFFYTRNALMLASRPLTEPDAGMGVQASSVQSEAGLALRVVRYYDADAMAVVFQIDTIFGAGVNDVRQGYVLESQG